MAELPAETVVSAEATGGALVNTFCDPVEGARADGVGAVAECEVTEGGAWVAAGLEPPEALAVATPTERGAAMTVLVGSGAEGAVVVEGAATAPGSVTWIGPPREVLVGPGCSVGVRPRGGGGGGALVAPRPVSGARSDIGAEASFAASNTTGACCCPIAADTAESAGWLTRVGPTEAGPEDIGPDSASASALDVAAASG